MWVAGGAGEVKYIKSYILSSAAAVDDEEDAVLGSMWLGVGAGEVKSNKSSIVLLLLLMMLLQTQRFPYRASRLRNDTSSIKRSLTLDADYSTKSTSWISSGAVEVKFNRSVVILLLLLL
ncbi:UNVERIFIED_CONTAM: hypothetical protein PYX00_005766 [Menopon gallinae]|uniref:Uncharacterized protein n=1 Tax=Menopon gallinae TaxID=328185 RepID=A0AAW2HSS5_9NEOP